MSKKQKVVVYKLVGEDYEITEEPTVYTTKENAMLSLKEYESFLGMTAEEAIEGDYVRIKEWYLL